jgi:hypothetical protein
LTFKRIALTVTLLVAFNLISVHGQTGKGQASSYSSVVLLVHPSEYFSTTYAAPPADHSDYVFFTSELLRVEIDIVNRGSQVVELKSPATAVADNFLVTRGQPTEFMVENAVVKKGLGFVVPVESVSAIQLAPRESLVFFAQQVGPGLGPGEYVVEWETPITEASGLRIAPQASRLQFEVRASSSETAAEEALRNAGRAFVAGQDALADQWVAQLLRVNPQSHAAYASRGELRLRAGDTRRAAESFDTALKILESQTDLQYNRWAHDRFTREKIEGLKRRLRSGR